MRRTIITALLAAAAILPALAAPASAAGCRIAGDRLCVQAAGHPGALVELHVRRQAGHDHVLGAAYIPERGSVWLEIRHGGRASRAGSYHVRPGSTMDAKRPALQSTTGGWRYDGPGYSARACATSPGTKTVCTAWH
ncbi:hypothetical protein [Streptomyces fuscigenes]|uniref:hypothetical protein n=1 Tax=Streptomyces fuscigenes TaxID=1528880 RepID=UPI001F1C3A47|nr:hypothetical protein [Streptomyces fuscigenes]MCF3960448.1 hypothetical protein [Streptomyces fuscigenes]